MIAAILVVGVVFVVALATHVIALSIVCSCSGGSPGGERVLVIDADDDVPDLQ